MDYSGFCPLCTHHTLHVSMNTKLFHHCSVDHLETPYILFVIIYLVSLIIFMLSNGQCIKCATQINLTALNTSRMSCLD